MYIDLGKGLSSIEPDRKNQPPFYLLYFLCSDDKPKPERPFSIPQILKGLNAQKTTYIVAA
jgi:hypothetical protein